MFDFLPKFLRELTRRKVWLFGGIYLALGWVLLQVAALLESTLNLPDWIDQSALVLLTLGFPVALLLAWAQESQGGENPGKSDTSDISSEASGHSRLAIAVLPFADMSPDGDQEWFSDGISEEILHRLAAEKELKVAGRTSSFHFKGKTASFDEIGATLSVGSVLEGSVRKMENRVRITAQLIEVATGYHIWSGTFDRDLEDIFRIQEDISEAIAVALLREIGVDPDKTTAKPYEPDIAAYQAFLKARQLYWAVFASEATTESMMEAIDWYERAIDLDPNYSTARAMLIAALAYNQGEESTIPQDYRDIKTMVDEALVSSPSSAETAHINAHFALWEWRFVDADRHFGELERLGGLPEIVPLSHATFLGIIGRWRQSISKLEALHKADPLDTGTRNWLAMANYALGNYKEVTRLAEESGSLGMTAPHWPYLNAFAHAHLGETRPLDELIARPHNFQDNSAHNHEEIAKSMWSRARAKMMKAQITNDREALIEIYEHLCLSAQSSGSHYEFQELAEVCVLLGKNDEALEYFAFGFDNHALCSRNAMRHAPDWPPLLFLTRDPRGRALMQEAGWNPAWFDERGADA